MASSPDKSANIPSSVHDILSDFQAAGEARADRTPGNYLQPSALAWAERILHRLDHRKGRRPLADLSRSFLLLVDIQRLFVDPSSPAFLPSWPEAELGVRRVLDAARTHGLPIGWSRHLHPSSDPGGTIVHFFGRVIEENSPLAELAPWLERHPEELVMDKTRHPAFMGTDLTEIIARKGCDSIVIMGVQAPLCVTATAIWAGALDIVPVVVADCLAAKNEDEHESALVTLASGLAHVVTSTELLAAWWDSFRPGTPSISQRTH